jgi:hypothetical protein
MTTSSPGYSPISPTQTSTIFVPMKRNRKKYKTIWQLVTLKLPLKNENP